MKLVLIRHAEPDYEIDGLTKKGWREAEALAKRIEKWKVKDFYVSPLGRAKATASVTLDKLNRKAECREWLQEFYVRIKDPITLEGRIPWDFMPSYWTEQSILYDKEHWIDAPVMQTGNIRKQWRSVIDGVDELLKEHGYIRQGRYYRVEDGNRDTIVCFCHLGVACVIASYLLGISTPVLWQGFYLAPSSVTIFQTEEREEGIAYFRCRAFGDTAHLLKEGEPISESGAFQEVYEYQAEKRKHHKKKKWL